MILPGHVAAVALCHRYLRVEFWPALVAGLAPDVIDKPLHYLFDLFLTSRLPMHALLGWLASTLLVWLVAWMVRRADARRYMLGWLMGYGAHLLCDSPLAGGWLPLLWPWRAYGFVESGGPLSYLFGSGALPVRMLMAELLLVVWATVSLSRARLWLATHWPKLRRQT